MKVLVTGGCGFFGAWIIKQLLEEGHSVVVVDVVVSLGRRKGADECFGTLDPAPPSAAALH